MASEPAQEPRAQTEGATTGSALRRFLSSARPSVFNAYCIFAAFGTYFCMYAYRKPFSAARFDQTVHLPLLPPIDYKIVLVVAQVFGYTLSKFAGIKVVSELSAKKRAGAILFFIAWAEVALLAFAVVPTPWDALCLFLNGMPLGMVWGLVFGFLEGRRSSELLGAGLSASYIVASGVVKSAASMVLGYGVSEQWMPVVTGLFFVGPLLGFVYLLAAIPPPTKEDEALRTRREPMDRAARRRFFGAFAPGLVALTGLYMLLTAYRDFRDNFAREIWDAVGFANRPAIFTLSELPIAFAVLFVLAWLMRIRNNRRALTVVHVLMAAGTALVGLLTFGYQAGVIGPATWMIGVGVGLYLAYVPFGCILFDRLLACVGWKGTAGFMIYVTDAFGYLGSVALLLYRNFGEARLSWLAFFVDVSYATAIVCTVAFLFSLVYFARRPMPSAEAASAPEAEAVAVPSD